MSALLDVKGIAIAFGGLKAVQVDDGLRARVQAPDRQPRSTDRPAAARGQLLFVGAAMSQAMK